MIRFAVVGCGRIGGMHARTIAARRRARQSAVYDIHAPAALAVGQATGAKVMPSAAEGLARADAVLIATATDIHAGLPEQCLAAGKIGRVHQVTITSRDPGTSQEVGFEEGRLHLVLAEAAMVSVAQAYALQIREVA